MTSTVNTTGKITKEDLKNDLDKDIKEMEAYNKNAKRNVAIVKDLKKDIKKKKIGHIKKKK